MRYHIGVDFASHPDVSVQMIYYNDGEKIHIVSMEEIQDSKMNNIMNLSYVWDYKQALREEIWAYFFMRGAEGYINNRHSPPIYQNNETARKYWTRGHDKMKQFLAVEDREVDDDGDFCGGFLRGETHSDSMSEDVGVIMRIEYEHQFGNLPKPINQSKGSKAMENTKTLFKVIGEEVYGNVVGENSAGELILELRGQNGAVKPYKADLLEEVMPHTIYIRAVGIERHFAAPVGKFNKGDILVLKVGNGLILGEITETNSKCRGAPTLPEDMVRGVLNLVPKAPAAVSTANAPTA